MALKGTLHEASQIENRNCIKQVENRKAAQARESAQPCQPCMAPTTAARPCCMVHGLAMLRLVPVSSSRICSTFDLPWNWFKSLPFCQNPQVSPESKTKYVISTIWVKGSKFDPFSSKFDMKISRNMNQIKAKMRSNIGATVTLIAHMCLH